jgi:hypothetical protein
MDTPHTSMLKVFFYQIKRFKQFCKMTETVLICSCNSTEHQIVIYLEKDDLYGPEAYVHIHLVKRSFWYRLKYAIKYVFGYKSKYGAWDEFILSPTHVARLEKLVNHLNNDILRITV